MSACATERSRRLARSPTPGPLASIDANGLAVAPGFIDIHNHSDDTVLEDGDAQSMIRQGVTSMIFGEGGSAAPSAALEGFFQLFRRAETARRLDQHRIVYRLQHGLDDGSRRQGRTGLG